MRDLAAAAFHPASVAASAKQFPSLWHQCAATASSSSASAGVYLSQSDLADLLGAQAHAATAAAATAVAAATAATAAAMAAVGRPVEAGRNSSAPLSHSPRQGRGASAASDESDAESNSDSEADGDSADESEDENDDEDEAAAAGVGGGSARKPIQPPPGLASPSPSAPVSWRDKILKSPPAGGNCTAPSPYRLGASSAALPAAGARAKAPVAARPGQAKGMARAAKRDRARAAKQAASASASASASCAQSSSSQQPPQPPPPPRPPVVVEIPAHWTRVRRLVRASPACHRLMHETLSGVAFLHSLQIVHRGAFLFSLAVLPTLCNTVRELCTVNFTILDPALCICLSHASFLSARVCVVFKCAQM
jgi:hypothetical protein